MVVVISIGEKINTPAVRCPLDLPVGTDIQGFSFAVNLLPGAALYFQDHQPSIFDVEIASVHQQAAAVGRPAITENRFFGPATNL